MGVNMVDNVIVERCIDWYRKNGNNCEISVWKLIRLMKGFHGMVALSEDNQTIAGAYAKRLGFC